jgi:acyl-CoA thioesterase-1
MPKAEPNLYLAGVVAELEKTWPGNRTVNLVFHGHSVPAGYFATPTVDTFNAYPHLVQVELKRRFPRAVLNAIVTAVGGENSEMGARRFEDDVLPHRPDVLFIDYGLNDRALGLPRADQAWRRMIEASLSARLPVILLTPTHDETQAAGYAGADRDLLPAHAEQIRRLADEYGVGLADSFAAFQRHGETGSIRDLLSWVNHPNRRGHELVAGEVARWFPQP